MLKIVLVQALRLNRVRAALGHRLSLRSLILLRLQRLNHHSLLKQVTIILVCIAFHAALRVCVSLVEVY